LPTGDRVNAALGASANAGVIAISQKISRELVRFMEVFS
jgi:hypothetical protein